MSNQWKKSFDCVTVFSMVRVTKLMKSVCLRSSRWAVQVRATLFLGLMIFHAEAQQGPHLEPIGLWEFNSNMAIDGAILDQLNSTPLGLVGAAELSSDGEGRTGEVDDRSLFFKDSGGEANPTHARVTADNPAGSHFLNKLNQSNKNDKLTVAFWQRWKSGSVSNSSSVWFSSPSSGAGNRGFQAHLPWGNQIVYFDTSGCCGSPEKRLNGRIAELDWEKWNHVVLVKDEGSKQVWVNGKLVLHQESGALPLATDWTSMHLAQSPTEANVAFHGWLDDVAIFGSALPQNQIEALASGALPNEIIASPEEWPPAISEIFPEDKTRFHPVDDGLNFHINVMTPNEVRPDQIQLILNEKNVSSELEFEEGPDKWVVTYSEPLVINKEYTAKIIASDISGRESSRIWTFNTREPPPFSKLKNYAIGAESYMMRFTNSLPPTENGNDGNYNTHTESTRRAVGSFFEVDLGEERALYRVRVVPADGFQSRMTHTTVRIYDGNHNSIFSKHLRDSAPDFDVLMPGPILGRYVRVGYENKERSEPGTFWYLGLKELETYGRPADEVGILDFGADKVEVSAGEETTLRWKVEDIRGLKLYPSDEDLLPMTQSNGHGEINVTPLETTEYTLVANLYGESLTRSVTVQVDNQNLPPRITEFVANNQFSLEDGFGRSSDWVEIRNPNNLPLNLEGYGLSDELANGMKWVFPGNITLPPHSNLIIFASGRDIFDPKSGHWHTNFALNQSGESLVLTDPDGSTIVDLIENFSNQGEDLSYGRKLTGSIAFLEPTPGKINETQSYEGWLPSASFSNSRGFYENSFNLALKHNDPDAEIWFSKDGRSRMSLYEEPFVISGNTSVKVEVRKSGFKSPPSQTHTYLFIEDTLQYSNMNQGELGKAQNMEKARKGLIDLPTINVSVDQLPDDWNERPASVEIFLPGEEPIFENAGVERFGGAWTNFGKKNYRLKFRAKYGAKKLKAPLFDGFDLGFQVVDQFDELDLRAGGHDMSSRGFYMSSRFSEDSMLEMGSLNPHGRFVNLYFNGNYWGQYHMRERLTDAFLADYLGGKTADYTNVRGNDNNGSSFILGTPDPINREPWANVLNAKGDFEKIREWVDIPHLIDFMLMWYFGNAESEFRSAGPIQPGSSGFKFWLGDADGHIRAPGDRTGNSGPAGIFGTLVNEGNPDFMTLLADRAQMHLFNDGALTPNRNIRRLERRMDEIKNSLVTESARWGYRSSSSWENAARNAINNLFPSQTQQLISRLRSRGLLPTLDAPVLSQHGGVIQGEKIVKIQASGESIYYTIDGTDPRLAGGKIHPEALTLDGGESSEVIQPNGLWRYFNIGKAPPENWTSLNFDSTEWKAGKAPLGYGDPGMATTLDFGPEANNKYSGYYFLREFQIDDLEDLDNINLNLIRDDGVAIYLNGVEIVRDNLPAGSLEYTTRALSAAGGGDESLIREFNIPRKLLRLGKNVLAAEVHQVSGSSSDLRFDAWLQSSISLEIILKPGNSFKGRAFDGTNWSALTKAQFFSEEAAPPLPGELIISEIHYNPDGSDEFEFIELLNLSDKTLDLSGVIMRGGVNLLIENGTRLLPNSFGLVAENAESFGQRYMTPDSDYFFPDIQLIGVWDGRLNDNGELIEIWDKEGRLLCSLNFDNTPPWPLSPDGDGSSLELLETIFPSINEGGESVILSDASLWRASRIYHGSPGRVDDAIRGVAVSLNKIDQSGNYTMSWPAQTRRVYRVESTSDLSLSNWTEINRFNPEGDSIIKFNLNIKQGQPEQFYRVVVE